MRQPGTALPCFLLGLIVLGFCLPGPVRAQDEARSPQTLSLLIGTPVTLELGVEYERPFADAHSFAVEIGSSKFWGREYDGVLIDVESDFELAVIYRYYPGGKAPRGGYGLLGLGLYNADTTAGYLNLFRLLGGGGYKWIPGGIFAIAVQGGLTFGNADEVTLTQGAFTETYEAGPVGLFAGLHLGFAF